MPYGFPSHTSAPSDRQPPRRFHNLEAVQLVADLLEHGLKGGEIGTVVHDFTADAYLVEFTNDGDGSTRALAELKPRQIAPT